MDHEIALGRPSLGDEELNAVAEVFASGWVAGQGPATRAFEAAFTEYVGAPHALAVSNCTAGLHLALLALGVTAGDEVIVADYTYPATAHAVLFCGATPRFADVRSDIWTVDADAVADRITERTIGVIAVDAVGQCADYRELRSLCDARGIFLLEDAACAAGASYRGAPAGSPTLAHAAAFSLHGRKGITCGEGGIVTTGDEAIAQFVSSRLSFGIQPALDRAGSQDLPIPSFQHLGWNYKLSDIASAIAHVQLRRIELLLAARRRIAQQYTELFREHALVSAPIELDDRRHTWQSYVVTLAEEVSRDRAAGLLRQRAIGCNIGTFACHLQPVYQTTDRCPTSADLFNRHLAIPMHGDLTEDDVARVARAVIECAEAATR